MKNSDDDNNQVKDETIKAVIYSARYIYEQANRDKEQINTLIDF